MTVFAALLCCCQYGLTGRGLLASTAALLLLPARPHCCCCLPAHTAAAACPPTLLLPLLLLLLQDAQVILDVKKWLSAQGSKVKVRSRCTQSYACACQDQVY
jgi:hypothetical protein